ncbi:hypothetical protein CcaCcLH18_09482 [Colletotrichum camelliae]|nr:hypothetical protein CcaCcLH18_09482 [Colletotrichum camelliae]
MAEPVGMIGTAAGLVSLGLQLYGEISNYLDAVKGRQQDLDFARHQCANLKRCIDAIDAAITSPTFLPMGSRDILDASVQDCQRELSALKELVLRLQGPSSTASTVSAKLREKGRKLAFPFLRKGMQELENRLESTINVLQLSSQTFGLDVLLTTHVNLGNVKSAMNDVRTTTVDACTKIDNLSTNVESIRLSTDQSNRVLPVIEERTANAAVLMVQQAEALSQAGHYVSTLVDDSRLHIDNRLDKVENLLAYIADQVTSRHKSVNIERDYAKFRGRYPIDYAVMPHLHGACHIEDDIECSGCDILGALLESDCALYPSFFLGIFFGCTRNYGGTADCALKKVILFLKERRQRLTEYAKKHLPPTQAAELGLYGTNVLDEAAGAVQTALQERSIFIPLSLRVYDADSESWQDWNFKSLHSYLSDRGTAAYVWELGFRDLGVDLATGFYELWDFILDDDTTQNDWRRSKIISHVYWLLERGADLGKPLPCPIPAHINQTSWTAAHLLSAYLARYNNSERGEIGNHLQGEIAQATTSISILDDCRCACTSNGCSPLLILLNGMVVWRRQWWEKWRRQWLEKPSPTLDDYVYDFQWFCEFWAISVESRPWDNSSKPTQVFRLILRYMTFTALGLRHSCCRLAQFEATRDWDIKDMDEIMEEQQEEILRLEDVLKDLEQDYMEISDLGTFVDVYWGPKVRLVMDELNARKLDEDDLKAAQEAGIEWHCFETEPIKNDYSRSSDLEYWMEKLNTIVPEPGSDIPSAPDLPVPDT